jgi:hypothetical protein
MSWYKPGGTAWGPAPDLGTQTLEGASLVYAHVDGPGALDDLVLFGGFLNGAAPTDQVHTLSPVDGGTPAWKSPVPTGDTTGLARYLHGAAFNSQRQVMFIFGGSTSNPPTDMLSDTWSYSPSDATWHGPLTLGMIPNPRYGPVMAYDSFRNVIVLYGGLRHGGAALADTWELDENGWHPMNAPFPGSFPGRGLAAMAYDVAGQRMILFGGTEASTPRGGTFSYRAYGYPCTDKRIVDCDCVDNVCCASTACAQGEHCNLPGSVGICTTPQVSGH